MVETTPEQEELQEKLKNMSPEELQEYQKQNCIFCQIISGKVPSKKIYEDKKVFALLDINPAIKGHVLLLPKEHYAIMPQMPEEEIGYIFQVAKAISNAMLKGMKVTGTTIFVANGGIAGQRAQHFMMHIIPREEGDNLNCFDIPNRQLNDSDMETIKKRVVERLGQLMNTKPQTELSEQPKEKQEEQPQAKIEEKPQPKSAEVDLDKVKNLVSTNSKTKKKKAPKKKDSEIDLDDIARLFK